MVVFFYDNGNSRTDFTFNSLSVVLFKFFFQSIDRCVFFPVLLFVNAIIIFNTNALLFEHLSFSPPK